MCDALHVRGAKRHRIESTIRVLTGYLPLLGRHVTLKGKGAKGDAPITFLFNDNNNDTVFDYNGKSYGMVGRSAIILDGDDKLLWYGRRQPCAPLFANPAPAPRLTHCPEHGQG